LGWRGERQGKARQNKTGQPKKTQDKKKPHLFELSYFSSVQPLAYLFSLFLSFSLLPSLAPLSLPNPCIRCLSLSPSPNQALFVMCCIVLCCLASFPAMALSLSLSLVLSFGPWVVCCATAWQTQCLYFALGLSFFALSCLAIVCKRRP
jgi:hypothetical protein